MKHYFIVGLLTLNFNTAVCQMSKQQETALIQTTMPANISTPARILNENSIDTKITFSAESNNLDFVPLSTFNNGLLIQPVNQATGNGIPTAFYNGSGGNWSFYTNSVKRMELDADGYIKTSNTSLLINGANPETSYSVKVHGKAGFDSSVTVGDISDTTSFISMDRGFLSTYIVEDDKKTAYTTTPTTWAANRKLPVFRIRHPNKTSTASISSNVSTARDFMILPYEYGMAIEYNGVVECWVGEWSIHRGNLYNDVEGRNNGWGGVLWVGDDQDGGGVRATARNNLFLGGNVNYGELSVEKFAGAPNGDFRFRLPSTNNQFQFVYGARGSTDIIAKVTDKGFFIPVVASATTIITPEKGQLYFDSTNAEFKGYNGNQWVGLSESLTTGSSIQSSNGSSTFYLIPHGLGITPAYFNVIATSDNAGSIKYVTADAAFLKVYYSVPPLAGSNNLSWNWQVKK
jgi:hypothetical protein